MAVTTAGATAERTDTRLATPAGEILLQRGGSGRPLLLLHGGGSGTWGSFHDLLAASFDVIAPVHPGFGLSDEMPDVEGVDDLVYHYLEVLDDLGLPSVDVLGLSFGGWVAAELAVHSPERVSRLVLVAPAGLRIPGHSVTDIFLMSNTQRLAALFQNPAALPVPDPSDWEAAFLTYKSMTALARFGWSPFMNDPKLERRLHRITAPTLVVGPGEDRLLPRVHFERYAERIPDARLRVLDGAAHAVDAEDPEALAAVVLDYLATSRPEPISAER